MTDEADRGPRTGPHVSAGPQAEAAPRADGATGSHVVPGTDPDTDVVTAPDGEALAPGAVSAPGPDGPVRSSRRFPQVTRDTARPEGGARAASGDAPAPARQWPLLVVLLTTGAGLLTTALGAFRWGTLTIGAALLVGAALRWTLPRVGMLAVRSRFTDLVTYGVLGVVIVLLALMLQPKPVLKVPFLEDTLHFTIT